MRGKPASAEGDPGLVPGHQGPLHHNRESTWRIIEMWLRCDHCMTHAYRVTGVRASSNERICFRSQACSCGAVRIDGPEPEVPPKPWEENENPYHPPGKRP